MSTVKDDTFNGYSNREAWCLALWLDNDEGLQTEVNRLSRLARDGQRLGHALQSLIRELSEQRIGNTMAAAMFEDVGSLWRVNWDELGEHYYSLARE